MSNRTSQERRWLLGLESAAFGVWDLNPLLETVHHSPQWKARLGFPRLHAADGTAFWRCRVHPDDLDRMLRALRSHLDGDVPTYEVRFRLRSNGSGYRSVLSRGRVVAREPDGRAARMIGTMVDLSGSPAAPARYALPIETTSDACDPPLLHPALATADEARRLIEQIDDLLDVALLEFERAR